MIDRSFVELHRLQTVAVDALRRSGASSPLAFASELREVHQAASQARVELNSAISVAGKAGVLAQVDAIAKPAVEALTALILEVRNEMSVSRDEVARVG